MAKPKPKAKSTSQAVSTASAQDTVKAEKKAAGKPAAEPVKKAVAKKDAKSSGKDAPKPQKKTNPNKKPNIFVRLKNYLHEVKLELKRVTWPTKKEVLNSSLVVIGALVFFGVIIYLVDTAIVPLLLAFSKLG